MVLCVSLCSTIEAILMLTAMAWKIDTCAYHGEHFSESSDGFAPKVFVLTGSLLQPSFHISVEPTQLTAVFEGLYMPLSHSGSVDAMLLAFLRLVISSHLESESKQKANRDFRTCNGASAV